MKYFTRRHEGTKIVALNLFQGPFLRPLRTATKWMLKRVQHDSDARLRAFVPSCETKLAAAFAALALTGCAATQASDAVAPAAPGFLLGLWHGFIFPVAWIVSLFVSNVAIYAVPNNGGWYDFGYFLGIVVFGVGAKRSQTIVRDRVVYRDRGPIVDACARRID